MAKARCGMPVKQHTARAIWESALICNRHMSMRARVKGVRCSLRIVPMFSVMSFQRHGSSKAWQSHSHQDQVVSPAVRSAQLLQTQYLA
eukprot:1109823-Rhodomonas_salina.4